MRKKLTALILFAIAFGLVEATLVVYLRKAFGLETGLLQTNYSVLLNLGAIAFLSPKDLVIPDQQFTLVEMIREIATIVMLLTVAALAGQRPKQRLGAFLIIFAIWDIFYYIFLRILSSWPASFFDIDVLFLVPVAWVGPVITPVIISLLLLILGVKFFVKFG